MVAMLNHDGDETVATIAIMVTRNTERLQRVCGCRPAPAGAGRRAGQSCASARRTSQCSGCGPAQLRPHTAASAAGRSTRSARRRPLPSNPAVVSTPRLQWLHRCGSPRPPGLIQPHLGRRAEQARLRTRRPRPSRGRARRGSPGAAWRSVRCTGTAAPVSPARADDPQRPDMSLNLLICML